MSFLLILILVYLIGLEMSDRRQRKRYEKLWMEYEKCRDAGKHYLIREFENGQDLSNLH